MNDDRLVNERGLSWSYSVHKITVHHLNDVSKRRLHRVHWNDHTFNNISIKLFSY